MSLLCEASPVLNAALTGSFKESNSLTISLPEDNVASFETFS